MRTKVQENRHAGFWTGLTSCGRLQMYNLGLVIGQKAWSSAGHFRVLLSMDSTCFRWPSRSSHFSELSPGSAPLPGSTWPSDPLLGAKGSNNAILDPSCYPKQADGITTAWCCSGEAPLSQAAWVQSSPLQPLEPTAL